MRDTTIPTPPGGGPETPNKKPPNPLNLPDVPKLHTLVDFAVAMCPVVHPYRRFQYISLPQEFAPPCRWSLTQRQLNPNEKAPVELLGRQGSPGGHGGAQSNPGGSVEGYGGGQARGQARGWRGVEPQWVPEGCHPP